MNIFLFKHPPALYKDVGGTYFKMVPDFYILLIAEALSVETKEQENIYLPTLFCKWGILCPIHWL